MISFFQAITTFPAALFTVLLLIIMAYWLLVIFGIFGTDAMNFESPDTGYAKLDDLLGGADGIPLSIGLSMLIFVGWLITVPATHFLITPMPEGTGQTLAAIALLVVVLVAAVLLTLPLLRPMQPIFANTAASAGENLVGKPCVISTLRVDEKFGQADYDDRGAGLILSVRASMPNQLSKGSKALIERYDPVMSAYWVRIYDDTAGKETDL